MPKKLTAKRLEKLKVPKIFVAGLILASVLGWSGGQALKKARNYYQIRQIFPLKTVAITVIDGDTFIIKNGMTIRLLGIDAPAKGKEKYQEAKDYLIHLVVNRPLTLEYDSYQDDKFGRILAYIWIDCLSEIQIYCHNDRALVNEVMIKQNLVNKVTYEKRRKLKYDSFLQPL